MIWLLACSGAETPLAVEAEPSWVVASEEQMEGTFLNRLSLEDSPYLLHHADNPVDWHPWGEEAFALARERDVPIFLSIGYAACHWCHVMAHESFEDPAVAAYMNAHFVNVKLDREERPDVDAQYMDAIRAMTGAGGWPASVWLDHELRPLYAGTYFPKHPRHGRPGFQGVLESLHVAWTQDRTSLLNGAEALTEELRRRARPQPTTSAPVDPVGPASMAGLQKGWDPVYAGWGDGNKFPMASRLEFLLAWSQLDDDPRANAMLRQQLDAMDRGGLHDHLGGGFHRYTVDPTWTVPHFEKMLYDNAQLLRVYSRAYLTTGESRYADVARATAEYLIRDMQAPEGAFYSSEDADSAGEEGTFYVWTPEEVQALLPPEQADAFIAAYLPGDPNFEGHAWVLTRSATADVDGLAESRLRLFGQRLERIPPPTDDKHVVAWNGQTVGALATAGRLLDEPLYVDAARRSAEAILAARDDGRLPRTLAEDAPDGVLEDYAFTANGLLDLYTADPDLRWLRAAEAVAGSMMERFYDEDSGGFRTAPPSATELLVVRLDPTDGAEPSGWGQALLALLRLRAYGSEVVTSTQLERGFAGAHHALSVVPEAVPSVALAYELWGRPARQVVIATPSLDHPELPMWRSAYNTAVRPDTVLAVISPDQDPQGFALLKDKIPVDGPRAYVCTTGVCERPADTLHEFIDRLEDQQLQR